MPFPTSACCICVLNQQQQQDTEHRNQAVDEDEVNQDEDEVNQSGLAPKNCTVVENGLVVVRPLTTSL
jgi:hypothetical protein